MSAMVPWWPMASTVPCAYRVVPSIPVWYTQPSRPVSEFYHPVVKDYDSVSAHYHPVTHYDPVYQNYHPVINYEPVYDYHPVVQEYHPLFHFPTMPKPHPPRPQVQAPVARPQPPAARPAARPQPPAAPPRPHRAPPKPRRDPLWTIQPGDTFWNIAQRLGTTAEVLQQMNPREDPYNLQIGSDIRIP